MQWKCKKIQKTENIQTYTMTYIDRLIFSGVFLLIGQCTCLDWNTKIILSFEYKSIFIAIFVTITAIWYYKALVSLCVFVSLCVRMSRSLLSRIMSVWKAGGTVRTVSAMACYIPTFKKFHARVHAISRNFTQFSRNLGYFSHFWANFNMLGIKKHVLEPRNSLVILSRNFTHLFMQFHANFTQFSRNLGYFHQFLVSFNMFGIKKHELGNSLVTLSHMPTHTLTHHTHFSHTFGHFGNFR